MHTLTFPEGWFGKGCCSINGCVTGNDDDETEDVRRWLSSSSSRLFNGTCGCERYGFPIQEKKIDKSKFSNDVELPNASGLPTLNFGWNPPLRREVGGCCEKSPCPAKLLKKLFNNKLLKI